MTCLRQATATLLSHGQTHCAVKCRELQDLLDAGEIEFGWNAADAVGIVEMLIEEHRNGEGNVIVAEDPSGLKVFASKDTRSY